MSELKELVRSNKITAQFVGEGTMQASFYKTHDKLGSVLSTDAKVAELGFVAPESVVAAEGVEPVEVTPNEKLAAFKKFVGENATVFGFVYDPVDRRAEGNKYPSRYDEASFLDTATSVLVEKLGALKESIQKTIDTMIKNGHIAEGSELSISSGDGKVTVTESYKNGSLKYADVVFPVTFSIGGTAVTIDVKVELVSGQLKKPRDLGQYVFTVTGLKTALIDANVLPKIEKPAKEEKVADEELAQAPQDAVDLAEGV